MRCHYLGGLLASLSQFCATEAQEHAGAVERWKVVRGGDAYGTGPVNPASAPSPSPGRAA